MTSRPGKSGQVRIRLAHRDEIPANSAKRICLGRRVVALFNIAGQFYATDDTCTHGPASLAEEGLIEGDMVECALHGGQFHIPTGKPVKYPPILPLRCYAVQVDSDGGLSIGVDAE